MRITVRAFPGYSVTGHSPEIFQHAVLADGKTAPALPAEGHRRHAAVAGVLPGSASSSPVRCFI